MSVAAMLPPSISKEVRALALPWLACVACLLLMGAGTPRVFGPLAIIAYLVGTVALGALAIGHEYTGRTLGLLLTLPARRERLLATKLGVLAVMLLALWAAADWLLFSEMPAPAAEKQTVSLIPLICALFLAPWLTMACRSAIAGTVFALTIPGVLVVIGESVGVAKYGYGSDMGAFRLTFVWFGTLILCTIGAFMSWRMFMRLEAIEGPGQDLRLPQWLNAGSIAATAAPEFTKRSPVWLLVMKELRLQQLPVALAGLYALIWTIAALSTHLVTDSAYTYALATGTILYAGLLSMLIGSSSSAGERQIGTLEWQVLLPMAAWKQWAVKVGVVFTLTLTLAIGLPVVMTFLSQFVRVNTISFSQVEVPIISVILLASGSLYVSSLCGSGLWALLMSLPAVPASGMFLDLSIRWLASPTYFAVRRLAFGAPQTAIPFYFFPPRPVSLLLIAGVIALALRFALINHRSADRPAKRVWTQVLLMVTFVAVGILVGGVWQGLRR